MKEGFLALIRTERKNIEEAIRAGARMLNNDADALTAKNYDELTASAREYFTKQGEQR